jgi:hypothetical protein
VATSLRVEANELINREVIDVNRIQKVAKFSEMRIIENIPIVNDAIPVDCDRTIAGKSPSILEVSANFGFRADESFEGIVGCIPKVFGNLLFGGNRRNAYINMIMEFQVACRRIADIFQNEIEQPSPGRAWGIVVDEGYFIRDHKSAIADDLAVSRDFCLSNSRISSLAGIVGSSTGFLNTSYISDKNYSSDWCRRWLL